MLKFNGNKYNFFGITQGLQVENDPESDRAKIGFSFEGEFLAEKNAPR
jgi:hypothetical protein